MTISHYAQVIGDFGEGGDGRLAVNLAAGLAGRGIGSTCIALKPGGAVAAERAGVRAVQLGVRQGRFGRLGDLRDLARYIRSAGVDVLHAHGPRSLVFAWLATRVLPSRPRIWFTWHDSETVLHGARRDQLLLLHAMRSCERVFGSSTAVTARLRVRLPRHQCIEVFTNGVSTSVATGGHDADEPVIIWAGRMVPPKDPGILVRAASHLIAEGRRFRLVMAGDAPPHLQWFIADLRRQIQDAGLQDVVELPGWVSDLSGILRGASIAVQTSHTEGLSMALLEQMMAGLAVVATDVGDTSVAVIDGQTGLLVPPGDEAALTSSLRRLLDSRCLRSRIGGDARRRCLARFSIDAMVERLLASNEQ